MASLLPDQRAILESVRSDLRDALSEILDAQRHGGVQSMWFIFQSAASRGTRGRED